jgi:hypothetical protein
VPLVPEPPLLARVLPERLVLQLLLGWPQEPEPQRLRHLSAVDYLLHHKPLTDYCIYRRWLL